MTKIMEHKASYIYDTNTDISYLDGYPDFIKAIVGGIVKAKWKHKILHMNDKEILDEYYRLTRKAVYDEELSEPVIRDSHI